jgi:hypothetical protein
MYMYICVQAREVFESMVGMNQGNHGKIREILKKHTFLRVPRIASSCNIWKEFGRFQSRYIWVYFGSLLGVGVGSHVGVIPNGHSIGKP